MLFSQLMPYFLATRLVPMIRFHHEYPSEKLFYDFKYRLYQLCNQNFHSRLEVSKSEDQVKKLEAEAISRHNEYPTLSAWLQERADQEDIGQEHEQTQDHLDNIWYHEYRNLASEAWLRSEPDQDSKNSRKRKYS